MRIAQVATLSTSVRKTNAGSVESLVWLLTLELTRMGHDVTVFAAAGSLTDGDTVATVPGPYGQNGAPDDWQLCEWINLTRAVERSREFDVIHSHAYLWGIPLEPLSACPMFHTMHVMPDDDSARLRAMSPASSVSALSRYQWSRYPALSPNVIVPSGVNPHSSRSLRMQMTISVSWVGSFLGKDPCAPSRLRARWGCGCCWLAPAMTTTTSTLRRSWTVDRLSTWASSPASSAICLLGGARALLYPNEAPEPFGLVLVEAMMCGTPVAAMRVGAVPEIVDEGVTGFSAPTVNDLPRIVERVLALDRHGGPKSGSREILGRAHGRDLRASLRRHLLRPAAAGRGTQPRLMNVVLIAPHPDDESIGCGGTVCHHTDRGDRVAVVFLSSGELGLQHLGAGRGLPGARAGSRACGRGARPGRPRLPSPPRLVRR